MSSFIPLRGSPNSHTYLKRTGLRLYQTYKKSIFHRCEPEKKSVSTDYICRGLNSCKMLVESLEIIFVKVHLRIIRYTKRMIFVEGDSCLFCIESWHPVFMFGNWDHCFVWYDNNVTLGNCVLFLFLWLILFFYNGNNVNLVWLYRDWSVVTRRSSFFHVSVYMFYYAGQWSINCYPYYYYYP